MATNGSPATLERCADWLLDHDGDLYGDEQERLRWYEGIAISASVQWLVVPWVLATLSWVGGRPAAPYLLAVAVAFYLPMMLTNVYVGRRRVRTVPERWSRKRVVVSVLAVVPYIVLSLGVASAFGAFDDHATLYGGLVGAVGGGLAGWVALLSARRRQQRRERSDADDE